jgi:hypothetical protein
MNTDTNHLIRIGGDDEAPEGYEVVPDHLLKAALLSLGDKTETTISRNSGGQLSRWAARRRKDKRKMQKASRRQNRGK